MSRTIRARRVVIVGIGAAVLAIGLGGQRSASAGDSKPDPSAAPSSTNEISALWQPQLLVQLRVSDLDRAIAFYRDTLGFELYHRNDELHWAKLHAPVQNVSIGVGVAPEAPGSGGMSLNFAVGNIDRAREILESKGVVFDGPTINIPNVVRLADFKDPDGNRIRLAGAAN